MYKYDWEKTKSSDAHFMETVGR